jgi:hypothetical protein
MKGEFGIEDEIGIPIPFSWGHSGYEKVSSLIFETNFYPLRVA